MPVYVQGDSKLAPPIPDPDKNCLLKTKYVFIKYNLFEYYLEKFIHNLGQGGAMYEC